MRWMIILAALLAVVTGMRAETVGLVLSGGGAKGIAHIGFIQALEDNDIPIDYVTGTSMGAIVGSLYSMGYTPAEMMELIKSRQFAYWSSGQIQEREKYRFVEPAESEQWLDLNLALKGGGGGMEQALPTRLINPLPMSWAFMTLYAGGMAACGRDFDRLMVPLRTVASDIYHHRPVVFSHGDLADAVRASMSFPMVFQPIEVDSMLLFDGGLYDVYPVDVMMRDFNPDRVIGVNVSSPDTKPGLNDLVGQLEDMITDDIDYPFPDDRGVNVRFHLDRFSLLDWGAADEIYDIGYKRGIALADSLRQRISARRTPARVADRRKQFRSLIPSIVIADVAVEGTTGDKSRYIKYLFESCRSDGDTTMTLDKARDGYYRVASTGRMRNLVPHVAYHPAGSCFSMTLHADVDNDFKVAIGGYLNSGAGSMLYLSGRYDPFSLGRVGGRIDGWIGANYMAVEAQGDINLATPVPSRLVLRGVVEQTRMMETETAFYDFKTPSFLRDTRYAVMPGIEMSTGQHGIASLSAGYMHKDTRYHSALPDDPAENGRSHFTHSVAAVDGRWSLSSLDNAAMPTSGVSVDATAGVTMGHRRLDPWRGNASSYNGTWLDLHASASGYFPVGQRFSIGVSGEGYYSTRPLVADYTASVVNARQFTPLDSRRYLFDPGLRANEWLAAGLHPVWKISGMLQLRGDAWLYMPVRSIDSTGDDEPVYSNAFNEVEFVGEISAGVKLPIGAVKAYCSYSTTSASHWVAGLSIGIPVTAR